MRYRTVSIVMSTAVLLFSVGMSSATESKSDIPQEAATANKAAASPKNAKGDTDAKHKHVAQIKLVDINSAKKEELKKLPGITDAQADKIIASRPLGSKAWLVTHNIIPMATYKAVSGLVVCKVTKKDMDKIMAQAALKNKKQP